MRYAWTSLVFFAASAVACAPAQPAESPAPPPARAPVGANAAGAAEVLFDEALALTDAGKHAEACPRYEESERLDHALGTLFNLADCYEKTARLASAWEAYTKVASEARQLGKKEREAEARGRADAIKPKLSRLTIAVPPDVAALPGVTVKRNGVVLDSALWNQSVFVDSGEQTVVAIAPGKSPWQETVTVKEAEAAKVSVPALEAAPMSGRRIGALVAGGAGVAGIVVGSVFGVLTVSKWGEAVDTCKGPSDRPTACPSQDQATKAGALGGDASTLATVSTIGFAVGGAGLIAAGILWFTGPSETPLESASARPASAAWEIAPTFGPGSAGGLVRGRF